MTEDLHRIRTRKLGFLALLVLAIGAFAVGVPHGLGWGLACVIVSPAAALAVIGYHETLSIDEAGVMTSAFGTLTPRWDRSFSIRIQDVRTIERRMRVKRLAKGGSRMEWDIVVIDRQGDEIAFDFGNFSGWKRLRDELHQRGAEVAFVKLGV